MYRCRRIRWRLTKTDNRAIPLLDMIAVIDGRLMFLVFLVSIVRAFDVMQPYCIFQIFDFQLDGCWCVRVLCDRVKRVQVSRFERFFWRGIGSFGELVFKVLEVPMFEIGQGEEQNVLVVPTIRVSIAVNIHCSERKRVKDEGGLWSAAAEIYAAHWIDASVHMCWGMQWPDKRVPHHFPLTEVTFVKMNTSATIPLSLNRIPKEVWACFFIV